MTTPGGWPRSPPGHWWVSRTVWSLGTPAPRGRRSIGWRPTSSNSSRSSSPPRPRSRLPSKTLADRDAVLGESQRRIEQLTAQMDDVTIRAFIDPPSLAAFEVLTADSVDEMSVRQAVLDIQNEAIAADLTELDGLRNEVREQQRAQEEAVAEAKAAQADAEAALLDVQSAVSQQTQFVSALKKGLEVNAAALDDLRATDPARGRAAGAAPDRARAAARSRRGRRGLRGRARGDRRGGTAQGPAGDLEVPGAGTAAFQRHLGGGPVRWEEPQGHGHDVAGGHADRRAGERTGRAPQQQPRGPELVGLRRRREHVLRRPSVVVRERRRRGTSSGARSSATWAAAATPRPARRTCTSSSIPAGAPRSTPIPGSSRSASGS